MQQGQSALARAEESFGSFGCDSTLGTKRLIPLEATGSNLLEKLQKEPESVGP